MAKGTTLIDKNNNIVYPRTILEQVYNKDGTNRLDNILRLLQTNIESDIADTNLAVAQLREELDAFLSDATVSGEVRDAIIEIKNLLDSNSSDVVGELVATMAALRDEAVRNVAQTLTETQKSTSRANIGAVGVSATYGDGLATLSYDGNAMFPETKGSQVKLSIGGNAEDAIKANGENIETERVRAIAREDEIAETLAETKEKVDTFLEDADTSEQAIDKLKELQDYIKNDETSASQMLGDIAQNKNDIADNAEAIEKEATRAKQTEMYLESQKADKYGYYENLSVGVSDNLSGRGESTESEFAMRPSGGENKSIEDGTARINSIKGNSVAWNSEYRNGSVKTKMITDDVGTFVYRKAFNDISLSQNKGDKIYICQTLNNKVNLKANASYLTRTFGYDTANKEEIILGGVLNTYVANPSFFTKGVHTFSTIHTVGDYAIDTMYCDLQQEDGITDYSEYSVKLVNLTKMFNGINVPTTVEEFESLYSNMPNEYNAGEIINNHTSAIKSVGVNAWDGQLELGMYDKRGKVETGNYNRCKNPIRVVGGAKYYFSSQMNGVSFQAYYYDANMNYVGDAYWTRNYEYTIPTNAYYMGFYCGSFQVFIPEDNDICIHLVHTGYLNGKYFPYESQIRQLPTVEGGLKSAGTAYDEIRYNKSKDKWEHVKRIGSVDLGTLEWAFLAGGEISNNMFASLLSLDNAKTPAYSGRPNALCAKYKIMSPSVFFEVLTADLGVGITQDTARIMLLDKQYNNDVVALKASLQGVILYYELATPIVTELDVDISPDYKVWDYGTEEAISEVLSTPVRINTNYGFNAVGQITDNTVLIQELLARVAVLEAQIAQANVEPIEPVVE